MTSEPTPIIDSEANSFSNTFVTPWTEILDAPEPQELVAGMVPEGQVTWLYGESGIGKSLITLDLALKVAFGEDFLGDREVSQANVLWLDYENGSSVLKDRLDSFGFDTLTLAASKKLMFGVMPDSIDHETIPELLHAVEDWGIKLLVIDSSGVGFGGDSNSADTFAVLAAELFNPLKRMGVSILVLDNMGKDTSRGAIGSSRKQHEAGAIWELTQEDGRTNNFVLKLKKDRTGNLTHVVEIRKEQIDGVLTFTSGAMGFSMVTDTEIQALRDAEAGGWDGREKLSRAKLLEYIKAETGHGVRNNVASKAVKYANNGRWGQTPISEDGTTLDISGTDHDGDNPGTMGQAEENLAIAGLLEDGDN